MFTKRFGVEIEFKSFDNRDFTYSPLRKGELPEGIHHIAKAISDMGLESEVKDWQYSHNNPKWTCKPDSSCGIEVCSPVLDFDRICELSSVMDAFQKDDMIKVDSKCSFHVHFEMNCAPESQELCSILSWWIKCEPVFIDFAENSRKTNKYCRCIGLMDLFDHDEIVTPYRIFSKLSDKYLTLNTFHMFNKRRNTIEFRLGEGTKNPEFATNWVKVLFCFLNSCNTNPCPADYTWLEPKKVFEFLNLPDELRNWFLCRLVKNCGESTSSYWSEENRSHAKLQYLELSQGVDFG